MKQSGNISSKWLNAVCIGLYLLGSSGAVAQEVSLPKKEAEKVLFRFSAGTVASDANRMVSVNLRSTNVLNTTSMVQTVTSYTAGASVIRLTPAISGNMVVSREKMGLLIGVGYMPFTTTYSVQQISSSSTTGATSRTVTTLDCEQHSNYFILQGGVSLSITKRLSTELGIQSALPFGTRRNASGTIDQTHTYTQQDSLGNWQWIVNSSSTPFARQKQLMKNSGSDIMAQVRINYDLGWPAEYPVGFYVSYIRGFTYSTNWFGAGVFIYPFERYRFRS